MVSKGRFTAEAQPKKAQPRTADGGRAQRIIARRTLDLARARLAKDKTGLGALSSD